MQIIQAIQAVLRLSIVLPFVSAYFIYLSHNIKAVFYFSDSSTQKRGKTAAHQSRCIHLLNWHCSKARYQDTLGGRYARSCDSRLFGLPLLKKNSHAFLVAAVVSDALASQAIFRC